MRKTTWFILVSVALASLNSAQGDIGITRLPGNPLLSVGAQPGLEDNVNGPSLIEVPDWVEARLGAYYLYFAHHQGSYIRLAYGEKPEGPFRVHDAGTLTLADSGFPVEPPAPEDLPQGVRRTVEAGQPRSLYSHIASPDVHVLPELGEIRMYYHGLHTDGRQYTRVAVSRDGVEFDAQEELLGPAYFRVFRYGGAWYALAMPGQILRSDDGLSDFVQGPTLFNPDMRHSAVLVHGHTLHVFYTQAGDAPESILYSAIDLRGDWREWQESEPTVVMRPETSWEGADLSIRSSARGAIKQKVNQLRDPALFEHGQDLYLYYSIAGESGIAVARVHGLDAKVQ